jgi:hypothetical protein
MPAGCLPVVLVLNDGRLRGLPLAPEPFDVATVEKSHAPCRFHCPQQPIALPKPYGVWGDAENTSAVAG